eukprot:m.950344 g.950344  ORF g.950344 m.950344 type:complete len:163 (-) comp23859_c0_seq14:496-984(-)
MHGFHANWRSLAETSILQFTFALAHQTRISHLNDTLTTAAEFPKTVDAFRSGTLTCRTSQTFSCNDQPPPYKRSMAMYVPVRPTPALQWTIKGFSRFVLHRAWHSAKVIETDVGLVTTASRYESNDVSTLQIKLYKLHAKLYLDTEVQSSLMSGRHEYQPTS